MSVEVEKEYTPHDREVVSTVIGLWKTNPASESLGNAKLHALLKQEHPNWSLSANRLKSLLKSFGLQTNVAPFQYANEITSHEAPDLKLPEGVKLVITKAKGKGLYASKAFKEGEEIWSEKALVLVAPLDHVSLIRKFLACAYCARPFQVRSSAGGPGGVARGGSECNICPARFCNVKCKKSDTIHTAIWHKSKNSKTVKYHEWIAYENFCLENQWMAAYAFGTILISIIRDTKGSTKEHMDAMAKVRQDIRQKAVSGNTGGGLAGLDAEQYEQLWKKGYELLNDVVKGGYNLTYEEYLYGLGMYNINNLDGSVYLTQSHLNHSCDPNVDVKILDRTQGIKVVAKRDLRAGEELYTTYVNPSDELDKRRYDLRINWGFNCNCARCKFEEKERAAHPAEEPRPRRKSVRFEKGVDIII